MRDFFALILVAGLLGGCATITKGTTQAVAIETPGAPGATCVLSSEAIGSKTITTPTSIVLSKSKHSITVKCNKRCYNEGVGIIHSSTEGMAAGNVILGGVVGLGIDAASGAMNQYTPTVQVAMSKKPGCRG